MLFNSIEFAVFLPIVFLLYWFPLKGKLRLQNVLLLVASYVFYGWWDWRFLSLIAFSSLVDYLVGIGLSNSNNSFRRKLLLTISIAVNLGFLGFFKYFNFFSESFSEAFTLLGQPFEPTRLNIVLPVGISFYTFQTLSYSIDVYRKNLSATRDALSFFTYVSFFPQLVAGPIERATNLLPQFTRSRHFEYEKAVDGLRQILWGLFKKIVIADNCAQLANDVFANYMGYNSATLVLGAILFSLQIYGDFSGYSDIAIGTARLFGFSLMQNFAFPYFARDIGEFWRRWHISLSTWFRDYLYIPLGGSQGSIWLKIRNTFIIFLVSGFWHGANWTFLFWGFLNAMYFLPLLLRGKNRRHLDDVASGALFPTVSEAGAIILTYMLTVLAWIFFRAPSIQIAFEYIGRIFTEAALVPEIMPYKVFFLITLFVVIEWLGREGRYALEHIQQRFPVPVRWMIYYGIILLIIVLGGDQQEFIYFQF
ncbi:MAG: MBOAT family protein [Flavobacteriales bacterium]|nr:MBOAT family protein [Flavobacteriales bacterium]